MKMNKKKKVVTHFLNEVNGRLKIKAKVDELPLDAFSLVLLLFQNEHRVVEQLLQFLVCVADAELFEAVGELTEYWKSLVNRFSSIETLFDYFCDTKTDLRTYIQMVFICEILIY